MLLRDFSLHVFELLKMANTSLTSVSIAPPYPGVPTTSTLTIPMPVTMAPHFQSLHALVTSSLMTAQFFTTMITMQQSITSLRVELCREQDETVEKTTKNPTFLLKLPSDEKETRKSIVLMKWCKTRFLQPCSALTRP